MDGKRSAKSDSTAQKTSEELERQQNIESKRPLTAAHIPPPEPDLPGPTHAHKHEPTPSDREQL